MGKRQILRQMLPLLYAAGKAERSWVDLQRCRHHCPSFSACSAAHSTAGGFWEGAPEKGSQRNERGISCLQDAVGQRRRKDIWAYCSVLCVGYWEMDFCLVSCWLNIYWYKNIKTSFASNPSTAGPAARGIWVTLMHFRWALY